MRIYFYLLLILSNAVLSQAQTTNKVSGKVLDSVSHEPLEYATITVTDRATLKVINGAITDSLGAYMVAALPAGKYLVTAEFIGYRKSHADSIEINGKNITLPVFMLAPMRQTLKTVTVTGSAPIIENKIDKLVYNAANDITSQGGLAIDVLKKVPMVNVDIDGNVELQGSSNIRFLINGKPSSVFGNSITDALAAIPASQIKSIEVITSPGAKYDAQGTGGIINIILKDSKMQGFNANVNFSGGTRFENGSANLNLRKNNIGINFYFSGNGQLATRTPVTQERTTTDGAGAMSHMYQQGFSQSTRMGYYTGAGLDWAITKKDNLYAALSYNKYQYSYTGNNDIYTDSAGINEMATTRASKNNFSQPSLDWSLNYKKNFKQEGQEFTLAYNASIGSPNSSYAQATRYQAMAAPYMGSLSNNPGTDRQQHIAADYSQTITEHFSIETGAKVVLANITSNAAAQNLDAVTNAYVADPGQSYQLTYDRQIYAVYGAAAFAASKFLKVKTGLRFEHTETKIDNAVATVPAYNNLMPSVTLSHDFKNSFLKLSYSRRLERPDYRDINPFINRADPYNLQTGNPALMPEIGNNCELGYNNNMGRGRNLYIGLVERINMQDHKPLTQFYTDYAAGDTVYHNVSVSSTFNTGTEYNTGLSVSGSWAFKEKLNLRSNASLFHRYLATSIGGGNINAGFRFRINLNATYQFAHNLVGEVFGNYNSASNSIQGKSPQNISYNIAFRKQFWNKNASIGITATNLFNEYTKQVTTITTSNYTSYYERMVPYRSVGVSFMYKFGKLEFKKDEDNFQNSQPMGG